MTVILNGAAKAVDFGGQVLNGLANVPHQAGIIFYSAVAPITGIVGTALSCLAGGKVDRFNVTANATRQASHLLPIIYRSVVGCLNEKAYHPQDKFPDLGYLREEFDLLQQAFAYQHQVNNPADGTPASFWSKHVATRGYYFIAAVVAVITRVADLVLGSVGLIVSLACAGQWDAANEFTAKNLTILGIIDDLSRGIRGMVNPGQTCLQLTPIPISARQ